MTRLIRIVVAVAFAAASAGPVSGEDRSLEFEMNAMAKEVAANLGGLAQPVESVQVGDFVGANNLRTNNGGAVKLALTAALTKHGLRVKADAGCVVAGSYEAAKDAVTNQVIVQVSASATDRSGRVLFALQKRGVANESEVTGLTGATANLPANLNAAQRGAAILNGINNPSCRVRGAGVCCDANAQCAVEIWAAPPNAGYAPRPAKTDGGLAFVPMARGEKFAVRLVNTSKDAVAADLTLDGVGLFAFGDEKANRFSRVIVEGGREILIHGWHRTLTTRDVFTMVLPGAGVAAQQHDKTGVGTIHVNFAPAWPKNTPPPPGETVDASAGRCVRKVDKDTFAPADFDVGAVRESVSVRYKK